MAQAARNLPEVLIDEAPHIRFTTEQYERLFEGFGGVEFIGGEVVFNLDRNVTYHGMPLPGMCSSNPPHSVILHRVRRFLELHFSEEQALVWSQQPLALGSERPEPDVALVAPGIYGEAHPTSALLVVEVADASLSTDSTKKCAMYARNGIPEYWIVDVRGERLIVNVEPKGEHYMKYRVYTPGDQLTLPNFPSVVLDVASIFRR